MRLKEFALLCLFISASIRANAAVVNGSFETPLVPAGSFTDFPGGSVAITGWTVTGNPTSNDVAIVSGTFAESGITFQAEDGQQWLDLSGVTSNSTSNGVTQDVSTTPGATYQVTFYVGSATDNSNFFPSTVDVSIDSGARQSFTNPNLTAGQLNWQQFSVTFVAAGASTNLAFFDGGASNNFLSALDNVSIEQITAAVPEASSLMIWSLLGSSLAAIVGIKSVRRRSTRCSLVDTIALT